MKEPEQADNPTVVVYDSQTSMRFGVREYTPEQAEVIREAVAARRPLTASPLPIDEEL